MYLRFQSVGKVFEIRSLFFKSGDSCAQIFGFLLEKNNVILLHRLNPVE